MNNIAFIIAYYAQKCESTKKPRHAWFLWFSYLEHYFMSSVPATVHVVLLLSSPSICKYASP